MRALLWVVAVPIEQACSILIEAHWSSVVHQSRLEGIRAFTEDREPDFQDPEY